MDYTPRVSFQDLTPERLVPQPQRTQPVQSGIGQGNPTNVAQTLDMHTPSTYRSGFSINDFAPQTQQPTPAPAPYRPLTPPTDDDGDTAMDWTPSQAPTLPPAPLSRTARSMTQQAQPAPFHGHLPANIVSPAHRLRNPPNQPTFRSATAAQKQNFFEVPNKRSMLDSSSDTSEAGPPSAADLSPMKFADPRFFPDSGNREETGLESLFTNIFSIAEEPAEVRAVQQLLAHNPTPARPASVGFISQWFLPLVLILLVAVGYKLHPIQRVLESTWVREFLAL